MKTIYAILTILVFAASSNLLAAQDYPDEYLGLPGDNLNLYAVMTLFQESETLEKFEQELNSQEQMINNLDLNGDNYIDYISVSDFAEGNIHNIVLRAAMNQNEQQDVAVFVVEKLQNGAVQIQLIGDEALYGPNYIVEPIYADTPNPGYTGKIYSRNANVVTSTYYDIAAWPVIRYMYHPGYVVWRSSWYWDYYPRYWRPWRAHYWHYYYGYHYHWHDHYYSHYRHWDRYRCRHYNTYYRSRIHVHSPTVYVNINQGRYRNTYSRPDQRRAGEEYYTQTASRRGNATRATVNNSRNGSRSGTVAQRQSTQRTQTSRSNAVQQSQPGRSSTVQRTQTSRSNAVQRNQASRSNAVQQSQPGRSSTVQRTQTSRSNAVQRTQPGRSSAVQRSQASRSNAVQQSQPGRSTSSVQRSQPSRSSSSVQRSSNKKSAPSVQRSSSRSSSSAVQRSQPGKSKSSVQRSQPSKSSSSVQRSQPSKSGSSAQRSSSSSRKSGDSQRSSSTSRRR